MSARLRMESQRRVSNGARKLREQAFQRRQEALIALHVIKNGGGAGLHTAAFVDLVIDRAIEALETTG